MSVFDESSNNLPSSDSFARQSAKFHPNVWGDFFISMPSLPPATLAIRQREIDELKVKVRQRLIDTDDTLHSLELIDRIQCLGIAYHFEKEIGEKLLQVLNTEVNCNDLYAVSLRFRLLRQQQLYVSCDVFKKFLDENGEFMVCLLDNAKALLSLYEAAYLYMPGEEILDKAMKFSKSQLKPLSKCIMDQTLSAVISKSLEVPLVRRIERVKTKFYLSILETDDMCNGDMLKFAKLDFTVLQTGYQEEIRHFSKWSKDLNFAKIIPFGRDRVLEGYVWMHSVYFEPNKSRARMMLSKTALFLTILDDIYDNYGTIEELQLLTDVIDSYDIKNVKILPQYMQSWFLAFYTTLKEFEDELEQESKSFRVQYFKEEAKKIAKAYLQEAKWANDDYVPKFEEYLRVSLVTSGYTYLTCASYLGMKEEISEYVFDWIASIPPIIKSICFISRVVNDIASSEFEQKRKHVATSVQCYIKEHGCIEEEACKKLFEMIEEEWKILNREFMFSKNPIYLLHPIINLVNFIELVYLNNQDTFTFSDTVMKQIITALFVEPIHI